ncbi:unnamed protein product [Gongylonema pulchrum]|uniref:Uncharacterized protein n=1 Tax=Gongylonema pulchrum TaxID=637853 RepID=A0A3P6SJW8_9BILA|nr:unnamed protein product [Gongylonema pulchrum]
MTIREVNIDIDCKIIAVITDCDLQSPVFENPKRLVYLLEH